MDQPPIPAGQWTFNELERAEMRELGRKLNQWLMAQFSDRDSVHVKLVAGAFQYVMVLQKERGEALADDFIIAHKAIEEFGIADRIDEPFAPIAPPVEPTEIEEATPVPSEVGGPSAPGEPEAPVETAPEVPVEPEVQAVEPPTEQGTESA